MARVVKTPTQPIEYDYSLADLTGADLRVLDLALSYFKDTFRKNPRVLPNPGDTKVLDQLHGQILGMKHGGDDPEPEDNDGEKFLLDRLQRTADMPDNEQLVSAQQYARNLLDDWSK